MGKGERSGGITRSKTGSACSNVVASNTTGVAAAAHHGSTAAANNAGRQVNRWWWGIGQANAQAGEKATNVNKEVREEGELNSSSRKKVHIQNG